MSLLISCSDVGVEFEILNVRRCHAEMVACEGGAVIHGIILTRVNGRHLSVGGGWYLLLLLRGRRVARIHVVRSVVRIVVC